MRDQETGLDYFNARYFGAALGRFTSPDPGNAGADPMNPQSWNAYAYALNNPLVTVDPSGADPSDGGGDGGGDDPCFWNPFLCGFSPLPPPIFVGGGGGRNNGAGSGQPVDKTPLPPNSFPGGETLGLPPGMNVLLPGPGVLLGLDFNGCEFGPCSFAGSSSDTTSRTPNNVVFLVCRSVSTGVGWQDSVAAFFGFQHCWIRTSTKAAGMGPVAAGPLPSNPFGIPTAITDQSAGSGHNRKVNNVDEACVNAELQIGRSCGTWGPFNNCNTFTHGVLARCRTNVWQPSWSTVAILH